LPAVMGRNVHYIHIIVKGKVNVKNIFLPGAPACANRHMKKPAHGGPGEGQSRG
jgi:hypothetical protein